VPDLDRLRTAAREWLAFIGDLDSAPVIVPFGDPDGAEQQARYNLAKALRGELFEPVRRGPIYVWSGEYPLTGRRQHWGGSDIWRCEEHPDWEGEELGSWESYRDFRANDKREARRNEADPRSDWEKNSMEAHAARHGVEIG
jgi:hypothetical protein